METCYLSALTPTASNRTAVFDVNGGGGDVRPHFDGIPSVTAIHWLDLDVARSRVYAFFVLPK